MANGVVILGISGEFVHYFNSAVPLVNFTNRAATHRLSILEGSPQLHWVAYSGIPSTEPQPRIDRASGTISSVNNL